MSLPNLVPRGDNTGSLGTASKRWSTIYAYNLDSSTPQSGIFSGSFSGSFEGDGSGLTGVTATATLPSGLVSGSSQISYNGITDVPSGLLSGSAQISSDISGSFTEASSSFSTRVTTLESVPAGAGLWTGSGDFISRLGDVQISGSLTVSSSLTANSFTGNGSGLTNVVSSSYSVTASHATSVAIDSVDVEDLSAAGTPSGITYLRGDNTWATVAGSGDVSKVGTPVDNQVGVWTGDGTLEGNTTFTFDSTTGGVTATSFTGSINTSSIDNFNTEVSRSAVAAGFGGGGTPLPIGLLSGSAQIASDISGSFTSTSASLASSIDTNEGDISNLIADSGSFSTRVTTNETDIVTNTTRIQSIESVTGSFATTGSNVFIGNQYISGDTVITGSVTVSGSASSVNLQELQFDIGHTPTGHSTGRMYWDNTNKTATLDMQGSDVRLQLGQEDHVYAKNISGVTIPNGAAVRISGATGANLNIELAISIIKSFKEIGEENEILGVATEEITNNRSGYVTTFGSVGDLDTSAFSEGDILYLSHLVSGSYSNVKPPSPCFQARVGVVKISNNGAGVILSLPQEPIFLTDISQVSSSGVIPNEKSYLVYDDSTDLIQFTNEFSGSFSGSFQGDGTNITGITATLPSGLLSGSAQIASDISGSFVEASSSFSSRVTTLETVPASLPSGVVSGSSQISYNGITDVPSNLVSSSAQIASDISGSFTATSASIAVNITTNLTNFNTLNNKTLVSGSSQISYTSITNVPSGIISSSAQIESEISGAFSDTSSSLAGRITSQENFSSSLDATFWTEAEQLVYSGSVSTRFTTNETDITNLQTDSGSFGTRVTSNETSITSLNANSSSYVTNSVTSSMTVASSSYAVTASYIEYNNVVSAPIIKNGLVAGGSFSGNPKTATITFTSPYVDNNYTITVSGENNRTFTIESKIASGFVINTNANQTLSGNTFWQAINIGEFN